MTNLLIWQSRWRSGVKYGDSARYGVSLWLIFEVGRYQGFCFLNGAQRGATWALCRRIFCCFSLNTEPIAMTFFGNVLRCIVKWLDFVFLNLRKWQKFNDVFKLKDWLLYYFLFSSKLIRYFSKIGILLNVWPWKQFRLYFCQFWKKSWEN